VWVRGDMWHNKDAVAKCGIRGTIVSDGLHTLVDTILGKGWHTVVARLLESACISLPPSCYQELQQGTSALLVFCC
jgi:hypothetical protein